MQGTAQARRYKQFAAVLAFAALLIWQRMIIWRAVMQLLCGFLLAIAALPAAKLFEKRLSPGISAALAMLCLSAALVLFLLLLVPPVVNQGRQLAAVLPSLIDKVGGWAASAQNFLKEKGFPVDAFMGESLIKKGEALLGSAAPAVMKRAGALADGLGLWLLAPLFAFYFVRDRERIGSWLLSLLPIGKRELTVKALREMRRETAGYLRGQLLISCAVGGLTALGLLICGIPAWLLLGLLMGILELIPYVGPFIGGVLVLFFSMQQGLTRTLWAMGVVLLVQQLEGSMLSPSLMSGATRLHPVAVLLCVMVGGAVGGIAGILLAIPLLLCIRATLRVLALRSSYASRE